MKKKEIDPETANEIKKELAELRAQLESQKKLKKKAAKPKAEKPKKKAAKPKEEKPKKKAAKPKAEKPKKKAAKPKVEKPKKKTKAEINAAKKAAKAAKEKEEAEAKAAKEAAERTPEDDLEEQFSDEQIRNFQIEKMDMDKLTNKVCEIIADFEDKGMLQSDLWKKLKLNSRDGSRLALRLERRGLISREKILQKGRWTYKLIIEQAPIKLESLVNSPCLTCPVEQKCDFENSYPEPSPLHCQLIEDWVAVDLSKKKK
ncbi:MAG: transcriptional regulator [Candidatus Nitrosopelagicus sp.]|nr:transcriptional regulator [Candidatus Nitrosopelagicus sp.]